MSKIAKALAKTSISLPLFLLTILPAFSLAQSQNGNADSDDSDSLLLQAQKISAATGRPIFAVAGQST